MSDRRDDTQRGYGLKTYCKNLVITPSHVEAAYTAWRNGLAGKKNHQRVEEEHGSPQALITEIHQEIQDRTLTFPPVRRYRRREPTNGKIRLIGIQSVKQQVCDYLVVTLIEGFLKARIGFHQTSSTKGKGSLFAAKQLRRWAHEGGYYAQVDVRQCYPSISHDLVMRILRKHVRSYDVRYVAKTLLATYGKGLDIGSYFSLRMAQLVLSYPYHHVASLGKTRRGKHVPLVSHQIWYLDDCVLLSHSKRDLRTATQSLERYLKTELGLSLKPWKISQIGDQEPIDLAGYMVRPDRTTIRDRTFLRATRTVRAFQKQPTVNRARSVCAYWGWFVHSDSRKAIARLQIDQAFNDARKLVSHHERTRNARNPHPQRNTASASHA